MPQITATYHEAAYLEAAGAAEVLVPLAASVEEGGLDMDVPAVVEALKAMHAYRVFHMT